MTKPIFNKPATGDTIRIKNMVCDRCIMIVEDILQEHGFVVDKITLGEVAVSPKPDNDQLKKLEKDLEGKGFQLAHEHREQMVNTIKSELIVYLKLVESGQPPPLLSEYLSDKLHRSYPSLSRAFSSAEGISIEKYLIRLRIERAKELLSFGDRTLSEIAWQIGYSSVQHLSAQFKKVTGMSVSEYKNTQKTTRKKLDAIS